MPARIGLVVFDGFTDIDVFLPWDLLNRVRVPQWQVHFLGTAAAHYSSTGLSVPVHAPLSSSAEYDALLFASGQGNRRLLSDAAWLGQCRVDPGRQLLASIDSGALLLAALGLLQNLSATTYPTARPLLESMGIRVEDKPLVVHGNVATAGGCLSAQFVAAWLIERLAGKDEAKKVLASIAPVGGILG